ncbi:MAG: hypothetical protein ACHQQQ_10310 [Bacteroidota bacterium]
MIELTIVCVIAFFLFLQKGDTFKAFFSSQANTGSKVLIRGIAAWCGIAMIIWGIWSISLLVYEGIANQFHFLAIIQACAILLGIGTLYQLVISSLSAGATEKFFSSYVQLLLFRSPHIEREDIFEKAEQMRVMNELQKEKKSAEEETDPNFGA